MLDDSDSRVLDDMERRLEAADPAFALRMRAAPSGQFPSFAVLCVAALFALPLVAVLFGPRATLVTADLAAVTVVVVLARRRQRGNEQRTGS